jgi:hypothetical protein
MKTELTEHQKKKTADGICITPFCMKPKQHDMYTCHSCKKRKFRMKSPLKYAYQVLKNNAKRRGKSFTLTFAVFVRFSEKNDYMNKKGTKAKSLQIDRIDETKGYADDNIQAITLRENIFKYKRFKNSGLTLAQEAGF